MILLLFFILAGWLCVHLLGGISALAIVLQVTPLLRWQLARGLDPNAEIKLLQQGPLPLIHWAAHENRPSIVQLLLEYGATMDEWYEWVEADDVRACQIFLSFGADPTPYGAPVIHHCRSIEMYDSLVAAGADSFLLGPESETILHHGEQEPTCLRHLLEAGHDPNAG